MDTMNFREFIFLVSSDLYRYVGRKGVWVFLRIIRNTPGFKYSFWMRLCAYRRQKGRIIRYIFLPFAKLFLSHYMYKYGINIPPYTKIGSGLYIGHFGCITVSPNVIIGKNCNVSPGIAIGQVNRGIRKGWPVIGDNVYIGPGAKIIGNVTIGNNVAIGANCVVTRDIPDNAVVVGIPGKVISYKGSEGYINNTDY